MTRFRYFIAALLLAAGLGLAATAGAQQAVSAKASASAKVAAKPAAALAPELEPKAVEILRAMSARLAAAQSMSFTATVTYEHPSRIGPALAYSTVSEVAMQRPDKLRVITVGDAPAFEFYYDGKTMTAFAPAENLVAVAPAPPTIDAMLKVAFDSAAIYFPFADVMAADPYMVIADDLTVAFVIGQSKVIGGTTTDVLGLASDTMFVQLWIGAEDKLPRKMTAVFRGDPLRLRHQLELSNWKLDPVIAAEAFASLKAADAKRVPFAAPQPTAERMTKMPRRAKAPAAAASKPQ